MLFNKKRRFNMHPFHLVDPSPWPSLISLFLFVLTTGTTLFFHSYRFGLPIMLFGLFSVIAVMCAWWRDVIREAVFYGYHTIKVTQGLKLGFALFILSEVMFFFSFFWAYLHFSLAPPIEVGGIWPPYGLQVLDPFGIPLLNTLILLSSGASITYAHHSLQTQDREGTFFGFITTIVLAIAFTIFQISEYIEAPFNISDGVYGSTFFLATGFHGLHVIIGTIFIVVCFVRYILFHFTPRHHLGFEAAAWYWHFVDVVWLFLFLLVYVWGSY